MIDEGDEEYQRAVQEELARLNGIPKGRWLASPEEILTAIRTGERVSYRKDEDVWIELDWDNLPVKELIHLGTKESVRVL